MLRLVAILGAIVAFFAAESPRTLRAAETLPISVPATDARLPAPAGNAQAASRAAVFVTLPMANGFADATHALVESHRLVHGALEATATVRLVERAEDSNAVLTVVGRGTGHDELTAALRRVDRTVITSPVLIAGNERYIEAMLAVGSCGEAATSASTQSTSASCYRKIFVGLGFAEPSARKGQSATNSWDACANALAKDVQAWVTQNASRLLVLPE